jgi:hypothetical protein
VLMLLVCVHRLVQIACKAVLQQLPADSPEAQRLWPYALVLAAAHAVAYAKKHLDRWGQDCCCGTQAVTVSEICSPPLRRRVCTPALFRMHQLSSVCTN